MATGFEVDPPAQTEAAIGLRRTPVSEVLPHQSDRRWRDALLRRLLATADVSVVVCSGGLLTIALRAGVRTLFLMIAICPLWILSGKLLGLYEQDQRSLRHLTTDELPLLASWAVCGTGATALAFDALGSPLTVPVSLALLAVAFGADCVARGAARYAWRRHVPAERALVIGTNPSASAMLRKLEIFKDINVEVVSRRDESEVMAVISDRTWLAGIDRVIVACANLEDGVLRALLTECRREAVKLTVVPRPCLVTGTAVELTHVAELPVLEYHTGDVSRSTLLIKRAVDICGSAALLVFLIPLFVLVTAAVSLDSPGPVLFRQRRVGRDGRVFWMLKFRTMVADAEVRLRELVELDSLEEPVFKFRWDPRVTRVGRLLRRSSVDELPQLVNVLLGQMSLVGPRPEQIELVRLYEPRHLFRLAVKPGLTGPMQVYGRGALSFEERLALERDYVDNLSIVRDLRFIVMTLPAIVAGRGAY